MHVGRFEVSAVHGSLIEALAADGASHWGSWTSASGPPVPITIASNTLLSLVDAAHEASDAAGMPRVYHLFMRRGTPRAVVRADEITAVWRGDRGVIRWNEGGYPATTEPLRKGGNAFIRGDLEMTFSDAWWMGNEETDLRILLARGSNERVLVTGAWARKASGRHLGAHDTDGDLWPIRLQVDTVTLE